ncbi:MAG: hypothetical protein IT583_02915 [Verrucomicrobia bacterium]|nr:hypothetical protein [Verrucomicrobiota bacterium]
MKKIITLLLTCLTILSAQGAEDISSWLQNYFREPQPEKIPWMLEQLEKSQALKTHPSAQSPTTGSLYVIFKANPAEAITWVKGVCDYSPEVKRICWMGLWLADLKSGKEYLAEIKPMLSGDDLKYVDILLSNAPYSIEKKSIKNPSDLDMLWGAFFGSGNPVYVEKIITALKGYDQREDVGLFLTAAASKWSLKSNAEKYPEIKRILEQPRESGNEVVIRQLKDILDPTVSASSEEGTEQMAKILKDEFSKEAKDRFRNKK